MCGQQSRQAWLPQLLLQSPLGVGSLLPLETSWGLHWPGPGMSLETQMDGKWPGQDW